MNFLLDENVPLSIKQTINKLGHVAITLHDLNMLGIHNGRVAKLALNKNAIIVTLDSDFTIKKRPPEGKPYNLPSNPSKRSKDN